ncbi:GNAT family N-acetyltransferase [Paenibacillus pinihumi]|uniref:GNAT family N-acetyltransferase n=1 Tax=Paenibacillus pinihumi TaxID=669462 RepID=UPI0004296F1A|nr:GNAT family protein [Paenibacillus pinihumi]
MELTGSKLRLSKVTADDLDFICRLESDREFWAYEESVEQDVQVIRENYTSKIADDSSHELYFIVYKSEDSTNTPIGIAHIWSYVDYRNSWEIGYGILPEHAGQGYGSEAGRMLLRLAFDKLEAHKVVAMCNCNNLASTRLMERIGMRREGIFKEELCMDGQWVDQYFYAILEREYRGQLNAEA